MGELSKALEAIIENPEDLSSLPQLVAKAQELEKKLGEFAAIEESYQDRIAKMQEYNRSLLAQIPIPGQEQKSDKPEEEYTFDKAQEEFLNAMKSVGGNV